MDTWERPLGNWVPGLVDQFGPVFLADLPTRVERLDRLGQHMGHSKLYVKRDDLSSSLYGGNKVRKLELLLGDAKRRGKSTLVTVGGLGSNHVLATALHGRSEGMRTVGVVFPQPDSEMVRCNQAAHRGAGVELVRMPSKYLLPAYLSMTLVRLRQREGKWPYFVPGGGSCALGALGFVNAGLELGAQVVAQELPEPEEVFVPFGTGGTAAGLALGLRLAGLNSKVVAVQVVDRLVANRSRLRGLLRSLSVLLKKLGADMGLTRSLQDNLDIRRKYLGPGYGSPTSEAQAAIELFLHQEHIHLESTYTGKAAAAFLDRAQATQRPLLFWNTYSSADVSTWVQKGLAGMTESPE